MSTTRVGALIDWRNKWIASAVPLNPAPMMTTVRSNGAERADFSDVCIKTRKPYGHGAA
jgi:hypothetical protein